MSTAVKEFYDKDTGSLSYIVYDEKSKDTIVIDPVLNYDPSSSKITTKSLEQMLDFCHSLSLNVQLALETHAHADHLTSAQWLKKFFPQLKIGVSAAIVEVQKTFQSIYNLKKLKTDASQFDVLLYEGHDVQAGTVKLKTINTPGHTPACCSYLIEDNLFCGDSLFMPDYGCGRCDFPGGSAKTLYNSITKKIYTLPNETKIYVCHDYLPNGRPLQFQSTVKESKSNNIQINQSTTEEDFIQFRSSRDKQLNPPRLLYPSIQININAGIIPVPEENKTSYIKIPLYCSKTLV